MKYWQNGECIHQVGLGSEKICFLKRQDYLLKIKKDIPEIKSKYKDSLETLMNNVIYQEFLIKWEKKQ